ncbi:hypothetical protein [Nocardia sp. NPDC047654]|uniref:hypothetical protein n=1 Tax=Nocardia sp. NPDC047654 TaxID=3364314 RepID=UPI00371D2482
MKCILPRTRKPLGQRVTSAVFTAVPVASPLVGVGVARAEDPGVASLPGDVVRVETSEFDLVPGTRPLAAFAVGTVGMGDQCAPSATGGPGEIGGVPEKGWAVAVTDYLGNAVEGHAIPLAGHITAAVLGGNAALDWLGRRSAGQPAPGNCTS